MDIYTVIILSLSDIFLMYAQINILSVISERHPIKRRITYVTIFSFIVSLFFELLFYRALPVLQIILTFVISIENCFFSLFSLKTYKYRHILIILIIQFTSYVTSSGIYAIIPINKKIENILYCRSIILIVVRICILISSLLLKHKHQVTCDKSDIISIQTYILIILEFFIVDGLIEIVNYQTINLDLKNQMIKVLLLILIFFTSAIIISLIVNVTYKRYYVMLNGILEEQVQNQLKHYMKMDKINTEIRQFRHDYTNHISCLLGIIKAQRYEEAEKYIINMSGRLPAENMIFKTGNYIADAILTDKQEEAGENITIQFEGCIISEINSTDLCIILSNALDNAIEACVNIPGEKIISVYGNYQQGYFVLIIKNPTVNTLTDTEKLPATSKEDNIHHGFGLSNIKYTVQKYNGKLDISVKDGIFILNIIFDPDI